MKPSSPRRLAIAITALSSALLAVTSRADTFVAGNGTPLDLTQTASWTDTSGSPTNLTGIPGVSDIAEWNSTVTAAQTADLNGDTSWLGIVIANPGGAITIASGSAGNLTLGGSGIDMSAAIQNLTLLAPVILGADQTWTIASGRTLTLGGGVDSTSTGALTVSGGTLALNSAVVSTGGVILNNTTVNDNAGSYIAMFGTQAVTVTGSVTINNSEGTNNTAYLNSAVSIASGQTLTVNMGNRFEFYTTLTGSGTLNLVAGTTVSRDDLGGNWSAFTGDINISGTGTLTAQIQGASFSPSSFASATVDLDGSVTFNTANYSTTAAVFIGALSGSSGTAVLGASTGGHANIYSVGALNTSTTYAGQITGSGTGLTKTGTGTLTLTNTTGLTYTGATTVSGGTLLVTGSISGGSTVTVASGATFSLGASNAITSASAITLGGGTLAAGAFSNSLGSLALTGSSTITLGSGSTLSFANSSADSWGAYTLTITGTFASDSSIQFGTDVTGLTSAQLAAITVNGQAVTLDSNGYLAYASAIPEPATCAVLLGLASLAFAAYRRRNARS